MADSPVLTEEERAKSLRWWPFDGDKDGFSAVLADGFVLSKASRKTCHNCGELSQPGTWVRSIRAVDNGTIRGYRYCAICCEIAARMWDDSGAFDELVERCGRYLSSFNSTQAEQGVSNG